MRFLGLRRPVGTLGALAGSCVVLALACTVVHPITSDDLSGPNPPGRVRVTMLDDRSVVMLRDPRVLGDTLVGTEKGARREIPLSDVYGMTANRSSLGKTALLVLGGGVAGALYVAVIRSDGGPPDSKPRCCPGCNYLVGYDNGQPIYYC